MDDTQLGLRMSTCQLQVASQQSFQIDLAVIETMTQGEVKLYKQLFDHLNAACSQLQHYHDRDGLEYDPVKTAQFLDECQALLHITRGKLIRARDFPDELGPEQGRN
jgi:hypothetical protein